MGKAVVQTPIALGMLFALALCWSLQSLWRATFGPFLEWLANLGISINASVVHFSAHPFRAAHTINTKVQRVLTQGIAMAEKQFVRALNAVVEPFLLMAAVPVALALTAYEGLSALWTHITHQVPRVIHQTIVRPIERAQKATAGISRATYNALSHRVQALAARVAHIAATIPHAIPHVIPRLGHLERSKIDYKNLEKWMKRALLSALAATVTLSGLRRLGLGAIRCANTKRFNKRLCEVNPSWIDDFIALTSVFVGSLSVVEFIKSAQAVEDEALELMAYFIREFPSLTDE